MEPKLIQNRIAFAGKRRCWVMMVEELIEKYGLGETVGKLKREEMALEEWKNVVKSCVEARAVQEWRDVVANASKLRWFDRVKTDWGREAWLCEGKLTPAKRTKFKYRSGTHELREELGRRVRGEDGERVREEQFCVLCERKEVEDVLHLLWRCSRYNDLRREFSEMLRRECETHKIGGSFDAFETLPEDEKVVLVLGGRHREKLWFDDKFYVLLEKHGRDFMFKVHCLRSSLLYGKKCCSVLCSSTPGSMISDRRVGGANALKMPCLSI